MPSAAGLRDPFTAHITHGHRDHGDLRLTKRSTSSRKLGLSFKGLPVSEHDDGAITALRGLAQHDPRLVQCCRHPRTALARHVGVEGIKLQRNGTLVERQWGEQVAACAEGDEGESIAGEVLDQAPRQSTGAHQTIRLRVLREH
jgi:hypothetical protein